MKQTKAIISPLLFLSIGVVLGVTGTKIHQTVFSPVAEGAEFVKSCAELNGKQLNFMDLKQLGGKVYVYTPYKDGAGSVGLATFEEQHLAQFIEGLKTSLDDSRPHIQVHNNSFDISRGQLDNDWRCNVSVKTDSNSIQASPYFQPD